MFCKFMGLVDTMCGKRGVTRDVCGGEDGGGCGASGGVSDPV